MPAFVFFFRWPVLIARRGRAKGGDGMAVATAKEKCSLAGLSTVPLQCGKQATGALPITTGLPVICAWVRGLWATLAVFVVPCAVRVADDAAQSVPCCASYICLHVRRSFPPSAGDAR